MRLATRILFALSGFLLLAAAVYWTMSYTGTPQNRDPVGPALAPVAPPGAGRRARRPRRRSRHRGPRGPDHLAVRLLDRRPGPGGRRRGRHQDPGPARAGPVRGRGRRLVRRRPPHRPPLTPRGRRDGPRPLSNR